MENAEGISVAVESAVHSALRDLAQSVWDKHGICIRDVSFEWRDVSSLRGTEYILANVRATTSTNR